MDENSALERYADFRGKAFTGPRQLLPDGSWLLIERDDDVYEAVLVRGDNGEIRLVVGALGKVHRILHARLGPPRSEELLLGSTAFGRYQRFDKGIAVWEGLEDLGYPVSESMLEARRAAHPSETPALVAFFDLRNFTQWSRGAAPREVQDVAEKLEDSIQGAFRPIGERLFLKGTGDGVMVVSEAEWFPGSGTDRTPAGLRPRHAVTFLEACRAAAGNCSLPADLAVGCGASLGKLYRVFVVGRFDYLGAPANDAAKIQQLAWNEVCVTTEFERELVADRADSVLSTAVRLPGRGLRMARR